MRELMQVRQLFPYLSRGDTIYLDHAATSPLPQPVVTAVTEYLQSRAEGEINTWQKDSAILTECREKLARLLNVPSERIGFVHSTTQAIQILAHELPLHAGDQILLIDTEFPANVYPFLPLQNRGIELIKIPSPQAVSAPELFQRYISKKTKAIIVSAVQFLSGYRTPLDQFLKLKKEYHFWLLVDAIQAIGVLDIDLGDLPVDAMFAGGQKWMFSPHGTGFLYISEALQEHLSGTHIGWLSVEDIWDFFNHHQQIAQGAKKYEAGTLNFGGFHGMNAALDIFLLYPMKNIEKRISELTTQLIRQIEHFPFVRLFSPKEDTLRAGIVTFELKDPTIALSLAEHCRRRGLRISARSGMIRFSPHFYNTEEEIEKAVQIFYDAYKEACAVSVPREYE